MLWRCDHCPALFLKFDEAKAHETSCATHETSCAKSKADNLHNVEDRGVNVNKDFLRPGDNFHNKGQCRVCGANCFATSAEAAYRVCDECAPEVFGCEPHELDRYFDDHEIADEKYRADRDKRTEGYDLLTGIHNVTSDVIGLFAISENIDSVVFALNRPGWAQQRTKNGVRCTCKNQ